jgi:hydrogenase maturation protease
VSPSGRVLHEPQPFRTSRSVVIFACGEDHGGDASVAGLAVASLPPRTRSAIDVRRVASLEPEHLLDLPEGQPVVVVDAVSGVEAGEIIEIDLDDLARNEAHPATCSSHDLSLDRLIGHAAYLREAPVSGRFVGVGIGCAAADEPLSSPVRSALPAFRNAVTAAVRAISGERA